MRFVIVGGAGFIGTALTRALLAHGHDTLVLDTAARLTTAAAKLARASTAAFDFSRDTHAGDFLQGADGLIHLGCTTNPAQSMENIIWDADSNIAPSVRLFDAAAAAGIHRVVFASSGGTVYGAPERLPVVETDPTNPLCAYGSSKLAIEKYLALYTSLQGISLRPANPYGPYQLGGTRVGVIANYVAAVFDNKPIEVWGDGSVIRDYLAIEDLVEAFRLASTSPHTAAGSYNIGSGEGASIKDVIDTIFSVTGREVDVHYKHGRAYDVPAIVLECSKFKEAASWSPRINLHDGISALWEEYINVTSGAARK